MRTLIAALALVLFGLSTAHADKAVATTSLSESGVRTTTKSWSLKNGTKIEHITKRTADGQIVSWQRATTSTKHADRTTVNGAFLGEKFSVHEGTLGGVTMKQTVFGTGANLVRRVEIKNDGNRPGYVLEENAASQKATRL
jgi:hypothetical protein